ncbi:MAG: zinc ribbon domain-containing protein [Thermoplasmata archaeon]
MPATPGPGAAPPPVPSSPARCPRCGAPLEGTPKFCPQCGTPLGGAPPAPSGAPVDLRQSVEQDRGSLKRLEMMIPGYHGYRRDEDIRAADSLLRRQIADRVRNGRFTVENARASMTQAGQFSALNDLAPLLADLMRLEPRIRSAEQGYSGIAAAIKVGPQQLDRLYEYDYGFAAAADRLSTTLAGLPAAVSAQDWGQARTIIATARSQIATLDQAFSARMRVVEGVQV